MNYKSDHRQFTQRLFFLYLAIFAAFGIILRQLWFLQIEQWDYYKVLASKNRFRSMVIPAPRGTIYDRSGRVLVDNRPRFDLISTLEDIKEVSTPEKVSALVSKTLEMPYEKVLKKVVDKISHLPYEPSILKTDLTMEEVIKITEKFYTLPGIDLRILPVRHYVFEKSACHLLGYTGRISNTEFHKLKEHGYTSRDEIGKTGAESSFEYYLRGIPGARQIQINSFGHLDKVFGEKKPVQGFDVYLTLDMKIQKIIENAYEGRNGAAVVMEVDTGNILAMISQPGFDPNMFATGNSEKIQDYFLAETFPLLNRSISSELAPGSIFKPLVALAALEYKHINDQTSVFCSGAFKLGDYTFKCWRKWGHGETNVTRSLEQSCNVFYYTLGKEMGWEPIFKMGTQFGLGQKTGIPLNGEKQGILPSVEWKKKRFKTRDQQKWHLGDSINYSIGQGYVLVTPIQMACVVAGIASGGFVPTPNILTKVLNTQGEVILSQPACTPKKINVNQTNLDKVRIGMYNVIHSPVGTGRKARVNSIRAAGKTGTAQVKTRKGATQNAWFICFAPFENPKIAMSIMVEGGASGGDAAAPIAKKILSAYFNLPVAADASKKEEAVPEDIDSTGDFTQSVDDNLESMAPSPADTFRETQKEPKLPLWSKIKKIFSGDENEGV